MKLYLLEKPKDVRTWKYPTFNMVCSVKLSEDMLEIIEEENGEIYIEQYTDLKSMRLSYSRVSGAGQKSIHSDWIKRFNALKK